MTQRCAIVARRATPAFLNDMSGDRRGVVVFRRVAFFLADGAACRGIAVRRFRRKLVAALRRVASREAAAAEEAATLAQLPPEVAQGTLEVPASTLQNLTDEERETLTAEVDKAFQALSRRRDCLSLFHTHTRPPSSARPTSRISHS